MRIENSPPPISTISKFDRLRGGLKDVYLFTKPSTIKNVQNITGKSETFIVETCRYQGGDYVFIECVDDSGLTRLALPPRLAKAIASQRDSLTKRIRSAASSKAARERITRGEFPGFVRKKKGDK